MDSALTALTPELLEAIKEAILGGQIDLTNRSPVRDRQLHDLRLQPSATDPRPLFLPSTDTPRALINDGSVFKTFPYPKLMWHDETHEEITVRSERDERAKAEDGYTVTRPKDLKALTPVQSIESMLEGLTEAERAAILASSAEHRLEAAKQAIASLSEADYQALIRSMSGEKKRGPGRPRKEVTA